MINNNSNIKFSSKVYGCQMNVYDSEKIRSALISRGWTEVAYDDDNKSNADLVIITGCSVRAKAEQKVWSEIGRYVMLKNPPVVALTGCIAQSLGKKALSRFPWVKLVAGPRHIGLLPDALERLMTSEINNKIKINLLDDDPREYFNLDTDINSTCRLGKHRAYVTIAHGCDNFCTYCIVPYVRGRFMSRPFNDIMNEIHALVDDGVREITLLGQNVNSYGKDLGVNNLNFASLLKSVARIDGLDLVRFQTSLPQDFTEEIVEVMATEPSVCPSVNLPVQSGSDRVLKLMNRKYTRDEYLAKIEMLRKAVPDVGITTDLIVGFPGETESDFEDSLDILRRVKFDLVHSAAYSERDGTRAATMPDSVPQNVRMERLNKLNALQDAITLEINEGLSGKEYKILVDDADNNINDINSENLAFQGRTPSDKVVILKGTENNRDLDLSGKFVDVKITEISSWCLFGEIIKIY